MDNKKFEQLIDMIINENEEQARELFHDIVVEKSREIYESMMYEEHGPQVTDMLDEINMEETSGMVEDEESDDEFDMDSEEGDDFGGEEDFGDEEGEEEDLEDRVVDLEDKLDELMAEFEELMGSDEGEEDFGDDMGDDDMGDEEMMESEDSDDDEEDSVEESLEESVQLKKIPGLYDSKIGGDDGDNTKSIALTGGPKVKSTGAKPVNFTGTSESGGTKGGLASPDTKDVKGAGQFKNAPGHDKAKTEAAPKPKHGDGSNGQNNKSVLESKSAKKRIK